MSSPRATAGWPRPRHMSTPPAGSGIPAPTSASRRDGRVLMVTIDGRQPGYSIGVTLAEAGRLMLSLGAVDAFNLDGGGSTVMAARSPRTGVFDVINRPSDGRERRLTQSLAAYRPDRRHRWSSVAAGGRPRRSGGDGPVACPRELDGRLLVGRR